MGTRDTARPNQQSTRTRHVSVLLRFVAPMPRTVLPEPPSRRHKARTALAFKAQHRSLASPPRGLPHGLLHVVLGFQAARLFSDRLDFVLPLPLGASSIPTKYNVHPCKAKAGRCVYAGRGAYTRWVRIHRQGCVYAVGAYTQAGVRKRGSGCNAHF